MGPIRLTGADRVKAVRFAVLGNVLPVVTAVATQFSTHRPIFFAGAAGACIAPLVVTMTSRRHRLLFWLAEFGGIPAFTLMQAYSGGAASGYSVLVMMAMIWFGLQATDRELVAGALTLAACAFLPMLLIGPPAYPVAWGHATLLVLVGCSVAGTLRVLTREMQRLTRKLRQDAVIDDLTGLLNRRGWRYMAGPEFERAARAGKPIALVTIDLDNFKQLNDRLGHDFGDRILRETAEWMQATFRAGDILARLGGDEFVVLLSNSTLDGALKAISRLREATPIRAGLSAGIAMWNGSEDLPTLMQRSDRALYAAKSKGGGQTEVAVRGPVGVAEAS
jgi:diguanylate cyclase (GGDEF)-like protein